MKLDNVRLSPKLWGSIVGLLGAMLLVSVWAQHRVAGVMDRSMESAAAFEHRITLAVQWKGATETTGERVLASNSTPDPGLTALFDERVKAGVGGISGIQAKVVELATSAAAPLLWWRTTMMLTPSAAMFFAVSTSVSPLEADEPLTDQFRTCAPRPAAATSKLARVRVEGS